MWYLIVSIPDLCTLTYLNIKMSISILSIELCKITFGFKYIFSQNELSSPIAANFCPTIYLAKIFIFMLFFLLIGKGQLDNDV